MLNKSNGTSAPPEISLSGNKAMPRNVRPESLKKLTSYKKSNLSIENETSYVSIASESIGTQEMKTVERPPEVPHEARRTLEAISSPERYAFMLTLSHHKEGLSFSQLARIFTTNQSTLNRHLKTLTHATLVWNFYETREGKNHSFYNLSTRGERVLDSLKPELEAAGRESPIHHHSNIRVSA